MGKGSVASLALLTDLPVGSLIGLCGSVGLTTCSGPE